MAKFYFNNTIIIFIIINSLFLKPSVGDNKNDIRINELKIQHRSKRDVTFTSQPFIKISINVGKQWEVFELSQVRPDYLINPEQLIYKLNASNPKENIQLKSILKYCTLYRNHSTHSAVLLWFSEKRLLNGIVGEKYVLKYKEYTENKGFFNVSLKTTEIVPRRPRREIKEIFQRFIDQFSLTNKFRRAAKNIEDPPEDVEFYLESMVVIGGKSVDEMVPGERNNPKNLPKLHFVNVLSFFNAIDMLLTETKFKLNIAGVFFSNFQTQPPEFSPSVDNVVNSFVNQSLNHSAFTKDSYDIILLFTDFVFYDPVINEPVKGFLSYPTQGIYKSRQSGSEKHYPIVAVNKELNYPSIAEATHHILHLIGGLNYINKYITNETKPWVIIRDFDSKCHDCFDWNKDFCAYVNKPRVTSLKPVQLVSENDQCWCYNYDWRYNATIKKTDKFCEEGFKCKYGGKNVLNVTYVLDGTPCDDNKVCWERKCIKITSPSG